MVIKNAIVPRCKTIDGICLMEQNDEASWVRAGAQGAGAPGRWGRRGHSGAGGEVAPGAQWRRGRSALRVLLPERHGEPCRGPYPSRAFARKARFRRPDPCPSWVYARKARRIPPSAVPFACFCPKGTNAPCQSGSGGHRSHCGKRSCQIDAVWYEYSLSTRNLRYSLSPGSVA